MPNQDEELAEIIAHHVSGMAAAIEAVVKRNMAAQIAELLGGKKAAASPRAGRGVAKAPKSAKKGKGLSAARMKCIAPGCTNRSKGPRFKYLCEKHVGAPKTEVEKWQAQRKSAATKG